MKNSKQKTDISIEQAKTTDVDSILEIENQCFDSDRFSKRQFLYLITKSKGFFYVAKQQGQIVGYLSLLQNDRAHILRIYSIAVHPQAQGRGIAQKLIDKAIQEAKSNDLQSVSLEVKTSNTPAISLYEKKGFMKTIIKPNYYADGSPAYVMKLIF